MFRNCVAACLLLALLAGIPAGCLRTERKLRYLGEADVSYYRDRSTQIDYPDVDEPLPDEVRLTAEPRTVRAGRKDAIRDMSLMEALHTALANADVIRVAATFESPGNTLYTNPDFAPSMFDPAIQESGVLFGRRGVESALSDFDPTFSLGMIWGRDEAVQNNAFQGIGVVPGQTLVRETGTFASQLSKRFRHGGQLSLTHNWFYNGSNAPGQLFPSAYIGNVQAEYRHPLLAGAGTEFTGVAGPVRRGFGAITGVSQGVVIARINQDITLADFEANVRNLLLDVERLYWDLYLAYRVYHARVVNRNSALQTWRDVKFKQELGARGGGAIEEAQARENYYIAQEAARNALADLYATETAFRRLLGLPVNDGEMIRPSDEPTTAEYLPDWYTSLAEALTRRVELRRQKWNIKSLELQLKAARSLTRPQLDFVSRYRVNAFGDRLLGEQDNDGITTQGLRSAYETLTQGDQTGWDLGFEMSIPLGYRAAHAQVVNYEHRLAKARAVLAAQELEISQELARAFQELARHYENAKLNFNRRRAAERRLKAYEDQEVVGTATLDLLLRAQASLAEAEIAYYRSIVEYNKAIANLHYRKGTLLELNNVHLAEGDWSPEAYRDALRRAEARSHAKEVTFLKAEPPEFTRDGIVDSVELIRLDDLKNGADGQPTADDEPLPVRPPRLPDPTKDEIPVIPPEGKSGPTDDAGAPESPRLPPAPPATDESTSEIKPYIAAPPRSTPTPVLEEGRHGWTARTALPAAPPATDSAEVGESAISDP